MKTLGELLKDSGISFSHIAKTDGISTQCAYQYKDHKAEIKTTANGAYIKIFKDIGSECIYNEKGRLIKGAKYKLVRTFDL